AAALALRELPSGLADHLIEPRRHSRNETAESELVADLAGVLDVARGMRIGPSEQEVESKRRREDVIVVILRCQRDPAPPHRLANRRKIESAGEHDARRGPSQT